MNTREDFEIYTVKINGHTWYRFKVDYFGTYAAPTEKRILRLREEVKIRVQKKLEWIERENQKYYARLAEQERQRALSLKEEREAEEKAGIK